MDVLSNTDEKPRGGGDARWNNLVPQHLTRIDPNYVELRGKCAGVRKGLTTAPNTARNKHTRAFQTMQSIQHPEKLFDSPERTLDTDSRMFRVTDLAISACAGTARDAPFGFSDYRTPRGELVDPKTGRYKQKTSHVTNKEKFKCFTEINSNIFKSNPGPGGKYTIDGGDWTQTYAKTRFAFLKKPRDTFTADVMKFEKSKPAPSKYHSERYGGNGRTLPKRLGCFRQSETYRKSHFTNQASKMVDGIPGSGKYTDGLLKGEVLIKPHYRTSSISHQKRGGPQANMWKINKAKEEDSPGPGAYAVEESITKTRWATNVTIKKPTMMTLNSEKRNTFIQTTIKRKAFLPAPGSYNKDESDKLLSKTRSLISPRQF